MHAITRLSSAEVDGSAEELAALLADVVEGGASVGFLSPLDPAEAAAWWKSLAPAVAEERLLLWVARVDGRIRGTVQLALAGMPNGRHRADVAKLLVHPDARRQGLGRALLDTVEQAAVEHGRHLLVLDTETDSPAERLYRSAGWTPAGVIPDYATDPAGALRSTTYYYKSLR
ncbi:GNAT family N-acetyltransferase [Allostreptomyces psammosilenae]|uniref:GNAT superfamily N-acetyltransferase n=1 Tax=Allostreptomyces psammosilenae TaxID=1892865 RepID=A0A852ZR29_9ACTN|nr:GNAT family N-acetyltransferase [Allostreptomyces psammosilenae]NYI03740.1 GNAT superfamily N-acetyltransferase [Allostreptomyces psammosilenae]